MRKADFEILKNAIIRNDMSVYKFMRNNLILKNKDCDALMKICENEEILKDLCDIKKLNIERNI